MLGVTLGNPRATILRERAVMPRAILVQPLEAVLRGPLLHRRVTDGELRKPLLLGVRTHLVGVPTALMDAAVPVEPFPPQTPLDLRQPIPLGEGQASGVRDV